MKVIAAYAVHLLTASGAALGFGAIILIYNGYYHEALWLLVLSAIVDSVDGALARLTQTKKFAAAIDGALMDNIIDFVTWTIAPLLWAYALMGLPAWVLLVCATASIFGFSNAEAKTDDRFFRGFPSYWNIVVLYIYLLHLSLPFASAILLIFAVMTLLPVKFVYPTRTGYLRFFTLFMASIFTLQLIALIYFFDNSPPWIIYTSFMFPFYYFGLSLYLNWKS